MRDWTQAVLFVGLCHMLSCCCIGQLDSVRWLLSDILNVVQKLLFSHHHSNPFVASQEFGYLLSHLLVFLGSLYCKQYGPKLDCSPRDQSNQGSYGLLSRKKKCSQDCNWIYAAEVKCRQHFQDKNIGGIRINFPINTCKMKNASSFWWNHLNRIWC